MKISIPNPFKFNSQSLTKQGPFWLAIVIPVLLFLITGFPVWKDYTLDFSEKSYENFLTISKLPLYLLSLSIPLVAIVAHIHRTIQTAEQIRLTTEKNLPDSYYTQLKAMTDLFKTLPSFEIYREKTNKKHTFEMKYPHKLFNLIYEKSTPVSGAEYTHSLYFKELTREKLNEMLTIIRDAIKIGRENDIAQTGHLLIGLSMNINIIYIVIGYGSDNFFREHGPFSLPTLPFENESEVKTILGNLFKILTSIFSITHAKYDPEIISIMNEISNYTTSEADFFPKEVFQHLHR